MKKYVGFHTRNRKIETSKKLLIFAVAMVIVITVVTVFAVFILNDASPLEALIAGIFGLASTSFGFYYWKAKNENISKFGRHVDDDENV